MTWFEIFVIIQRDLAFTYINLPFWELLNVQCHYDVRGLRDGYARTVKR